MKRTFAIKKMDCASCAFAIEMAARSIVGVKSASVNSASQKLFIEEEGVPEGVIEESVKKIGYEVSAVSHEDMHHMPESHGSHGTTMEGRDHQSEHHDHAKAESDTEIKILRRKMQLGVVASVVTLLLMFGGKAVAAIPAEVALVIIIALATPVEFWVGKQFWRGMFFEFKRLRPGMDSLVALGTGAAYFFSTAIVIARLTPSLAQSFIAQFDPYLDVAVVVTTFIIVGKYLEAKAKGSASEAIKKLLGLQAHTAHRVGANGVIEDIDIRDVQSGDVLVVKQGEKVPTDGIIIQGNPSLDESMVTGESLPSDKKTGDTVIGATVVQSGVFNMKATNVGSQTFLAHMVRIVEEAQGSKAPIQKLVDTITQYFVPIVLVVALGTFVVWFLIGPEPSLVFAFVNAVAVLVVACPCALGLATPISVITGTGKGAQNGIIVRNAASLEHAGKITAVVLDKTGTITQGKPAVTDIQPIGENSPTDLEIIRLAASLGAQTTHPLDVAIVKKAKEDDISLGAVTNFQAVTGKGIQGSIDGERYALGNEKIVQEAGGAISENIKAIADGFHGQGKTALYVVKQKSVIGIIGVADTLKPTAQEAVAKLKKLNVEVWMMTGDNERAARAIAASVGIEKILASVLPEQKAQKIKELQQQGKVVAMVGDGINDAPALAQADVGIAIGTGTDIAIESAGITLVSGDPLGVWRAIILSRKTLANIKQNLFWAYVYNIVLIPVAAGALYPVARILLNPILAGAAMALSSLSVVLNALRLKRIKLKV